MASLILGLKGKVFIDRRLQRWQRWLQHSCWDWHLHFCELNQYLLLHKPFQKVSCSESCLRFRYIIFIDLHIFGTSPMILFQRGFRYKRRVKALKDGLVLTHLGAPEHYILMRFIIINSMFQSNHTMLKIHVSYMHVYHYFQLPDYIRFCFLTLWWGTEKVCGRSIRTHGVNCGIGHVVAKVWCGTKRIPWICGASYGSNNSHQEWIVVQAKEEV